jgi:hypothetical protein
MRTRRHGRCPASLIDRSAPFTGVPFWCPNMRLLDRVARCRAPFALALAHHPSAPFQVTGPSRYAARVAGCPLRFGLGDDVRGHLVRREDRVFWRVPHLRGSAARGMVRSRTVCLSIAQPRAFEWSGAGRA